MSIEQQADAILAAACGVVGDAAVDAMLAALQRWIEAGARTDLQADRRSARGLLMQAMDRATANRGIG